MTRHVLCLGYSVTERPGYVERANALAVAEGRDIVFLKSGWGGHSLHSIAYLIGEILDAQPCDFVLLELFTGDVRYFNRRQMRIYLDEILAETARRGLPVAFLNLYQGGVDYGVEPVAGLLEEFRALYGIPCLDIASVIATVAAGDVGYLLKDSTHVAPAGADLYGLLVYAFLRSPPPSHAYAADFRGLPHRFVSLPLRTLPGRACTFELRRNGIPLHFLEIAEDEHVQIDLGNTYRVLGVMVTFGPTSGWMRFWNGKKGSAVLAYDESSYYTRSFLMPVYFNSVRKFWAAQLNYVPDVPLRKGEIDRAARTGRISHVFCQRALDTTERIALLRHRSRHRLRVWRMRIRRTFRW